MTQSIPPPSSFKSLSPTEAAALLKSTTPPYLLDVREPQEYALCHITGSHLIPLSELARTWPTLPNDKSILVYCHHGVRSSHAVSFLNAQGLSAINLTGGIHAWAEVIEHTMPRY